MSRKTEAANRAYETGLEASKLQAKLTRAESALRMLGYELRPEGLPYPFGVEMLGWQLSREACEAQREEREAAKAAHQKDIDAAVEQSRLDTLAAVIDALELTEYGYRRSNSTGFAYPAVEIRGALGLGPKGPERLWSDIETALALRAEDRARADRRVVETRIRRITKPHPLATGGYTGSVHASQISVDALSAASISKLAEQIRTKVVVDPKPEPASKKPKAKKKAAKK
jgi:hypothetical protein